MLDDIGDVKEMVIEWLAVSVAVYLKAGSPSQDYSLLAGTFIKSKQGDIDVGAMLNNYSTHPSERHSLWAGDIKSATNIKDMAKAEGVTSRANTAKSMEGEGGEQGN